MVNVCFAGITGWTAAAIAAAIDQADDLTLSSGVSRSAAGKSLATATGSASHGSVYATVSEALESAEVDVLVDYTSAAAVKNNVWTAVGARVHVVPACKHAEAEWVAKASRVRNTRSAFIPGPATS